MPSSIGAPRQRNTDAEKAALKEGHIPQDWTDKPARLAQKDRDARWTLKRAKARKAKDDGTKSKVEIAIPVFGYKNHVSIDRAHGFVRRFTVTSAAAHDGARLPAVLDKTNTASDVWADTAYRSAANEAHLARHGLRSKIHFRRKPGFDLTASERRANRARSAVRSAVETVFAAQKHRFGLVVRTIGISRAATKIGLANLAYNIKRFIWIEGRTAPA
jgi:IS5 family transposase